MPGYAPRHELHDGRSNNSLQKEARSVLERDAKHALKSQNSQERLLGVRAVELLS